jgi:hypothetical protein
MFLALRDYLATDLQSPTAADEQLDRQAQALAVMRQTAEFHSLPAGQSPTPDQLTEACRALGLDWSYSSVGLAFTTWRQATRAYRGETTRPTAAQRALRSATLRQKRHHEDYLAILREWLDPPPPSTAPPAYDEWVTRRNEKRPDDPPAVKTHAVRRALALTWEAILAVAREEITLRDAQASELARRLGHLGDLSFVGLAEAALMTGETVTIMQHAAGQPGFPVPVARFSGRRAWDPQDIEAWHRDEGSLSENCSSASRTTSKARPSPRSSGSCPAR